MRKKLAAVPRGFLDRKELLLVLRDTDPLDITIPIADPFVLLQSVSALRGSREHIQDVEASPAQTQVRLVLSHVDEVPNNLPLLRILDQVVYAALR